MAYSIDVHRGEGLRTATGQVSGTATIFKLHSSWTYVVDCIVTSAGSASLKLMTDTVDPTDFSAMSIANDGTQTANFSREVKGCTYIGLDVGSGTWTIKVRRV